MQRIPPFRPEPLATLRARLDKALQDDYLFTQTKWMPMYRRRNVFDFHRGLRLVVSFDTAIPGTVGILRVTGSFSSPAAQLGAIRELLRAGRLPLTAAGEFPYYSLPGEGMQVEVDASQLLDWVIGHFHALCQWPCPLEFIDVGVRGALHFLGPGRCRYETMGSGGRLRQRTHRRD